MKGDGRGFWTILVVMLIIIGFGLLMQAAS